MQIKKVRLRTNSAEDGKEDHSPGMIDSIKDRLRKGRASDDIAGGAVHAP
jgi:hypothetical protein